MSDPSSSRPGTFGREIVIIRQRFFLDYTVESKKFFKEEFTMMCKTVNQNGIDNIFIKSPKFYPNLKIYDSDGSQLALTTNRHTIALIRNLMEHSNEQARHELTNILNDMNNHKIYLLWIKLPHSKRFFKNETRVITLEYEATKEETSQKTRVMEFHSAPHEVFYVITPPEDYNFDKKEIEYFDRQTNKMKRKETDWKNKDGNPVYLNESQNSVTVRVRPNTEDLILFAYSFKPKETIVTFPMLALVLLTGAAFLVAYSNLDTYTELCSLLRSCWLGDPFLDKQVELSFGIIAAALVVPRLIANIDIRNSLRFYFFIPIVVAGIGLFL